MQAPRHTALGPAGLHRCYQPRSHGTVFGLRLALGIMSVTQTVKSFQVVDSAQRTRSVAYTEWRSSMCKEANPKVVVCVHGLTRNGHDFDYIAPAIAALHNYVVYALDVVGRGSSDYLTSGHDSYGYALYVKDAERFLQHLNIETVDVWLGTSMGGLIGMHLCHHRPGAIKNLILNDVGIVCPKEALNRLTEYVGKNPAFDSEADVVNYCKSIYAGYGKDLPEDRWKHLSETSVFTCRELQQDVYRLIYDPRIGDGWTHEFTSDLDLSFLWDSVTCNVLLLRGAESDMLTREVAERMANPELNAGKRTVTLLEFAGTGHAPSLMVIEQIFPVLDWIRRSN